MADLIVAFDCETHRIGPGNIAPPVVCGIFSWRNDNGPANGIDTNISGNHPDDCLEDKIEWLLTDPDLRVVTHNGGFDYAAICRTWPRLIPAVYALLRSGRATDTLWREKLLNLSTSGRLDQVELPDGTFKPLRYRLQDLVENYLGLDISADKEGDEDAWRLNFDSLDGLQAEDYPEEARKYAISDGEYTLQVCYAQEARKAQWQMASTETEEVQLFKSFVLQLMSAWGMAVDPAATAEMEAAVTKVIEENRTLLEAEGILRAQDSVGQPYARDLTRAYDLLVAHGLVDPFGTSDELVEWTPYADFLREEGIKFKQTTGKPGSLNTKCLQDYLSDLYHRLGELPTMTAGGSRGPQIKCDAEIQEYLAGKDPVMAQYYERQALQKLVTQMIPMLRSGSVVHPSYDAVKETGRTSSFDGGKRRIEGKEQRIYPSVNIQQIPNEIRGLDPRRCFRPRKGTVFFDVDITGLELACVGHVTYELLGESVHRDLYNAGVDLHGYLGAQLALNSDESAHPLLRDFQTACRDEGIRAYPMAVYEAFQLLKVHDEEDVRKFYKHFRNFAKPVGLGFPGGLGPATMVEFARKTYGVVLTEEQAYAFREFWRVTYPEMPRFFDWINGQTDQFNTGRGGETLYEYITPMGMVRRGATFCAAANGTCMQSPGAEAATTGAILVSQACYDPTAGPDGSPSVLYGCRPIAFVHDQIIGETTRDRTLWSAQCEEVARLIRVGAEMVLTSIKMRTDEALLTHVWSKAAVPVRNEQGNLIPWRPE